VELDEAIHSLENVPADEVDPTKIRMPNLAQR
jgi:hypothetical protein